MGRSLSADIRDRRQYDDTVANHALQRPAGASRMPSVRPVRRVAGLGSLVASFASHMGSNLQSKARRVRNPNVPIGIRCSSLGSCVMCYCRLTRQSVARTISRLGVAIGFPDMRSATPDQLLRALDVLEIERNRFLERLRLFDRRRLRRKMHGGRSPLATELSDLFKPDWFVSHTHIESHHDT